MPAPSAMPAPTSPLEALLSYRVGLAGRLLRAWADDEVGATPRIAGPSG
jgi:hypothetical protein